MENKNFANVVMHINENIVENKVLERIAIPFNYIEIEKVGIMERKITVLKTTRKGKWKMKRGDNKST